MFKVLMTDSKLLLEFYSPFITTALTKPGCIRCRVLAEVTVKNIFGISTVQQTREHTMQFFLSKALKFSNEVLFAPVASGLPETVTTGQGPE